MTLPELTPDITEQIKAIAAQPGAYKIRVPKKMWLYLNSGQPPKLMLCRM